MDMFILYAVGFISHDEKNFPFEYFRLLNIHECMCVCVWEKV